MDDARLYNRNVRSHEALLTPRQVKFRIPITARARSTVLNGRAAVERILDRLDHRLLVLVGRARYTTRPPPWTMQAG